MPCMAGLFALGHAVFHPFLVKDQKTLAPDIFCCVDLGGGCVE